MFSIVVIYLLQHFFPKLKKLKMKNALIVLTVGWQDYLDQKRFHCCQWILSLSFLFFRLVFPLIQFFSSRDTFGTKNDNFVCWVPILGANGAVFDVGIKKELTIFSSLLGTFNEFLLHLLLFILGLTNLESLLRSREVSRHSTNFTRPARPYQPWKQKKNYPSDL